MQAQMQNSGQHIVGVQSPLATLTNSYVRKKPRPWLTPTSASHSSQHTSEALPADMATREPHVLHTPPPSAHRLLGGLSPPTLRCLAAKPPSHSSPCREQPLPSYHPHIQPDMANPGHPSGLNTDVPSS